MGYKFSTKLKSIKISYEELIKLLTKTEEIVGKLTHISLEIEYKRTSYDITASSLEEFQNKVESIYLELFKCVPEFRLYATNRISTIIIFGDYDGPSVTLECSTEEYLRKLRDLFVQVLSKSSSLHNVFFIYLLKISSIIIPSILVILVIILVKLAKYIHEYDAATYILLGSLGALIAELIALLVWYLTKEPIIGSASVLYFEEHSCDDPASIAIKKIAKIIFATITVLIIPIIIKLL